MTERDTNIETKSPREHVADAYDTMIQTGDSNKLCLLGFDLLAKHDTPNVIRRENFSIFLSHIGLNPDETFKAWDMSHSAMKWDNPDDISELNIVYSENFLSICDLETKRPGSVKVLSDEFGIQNFERYAHDENNEVLVR